jgi:hypothetical protein
MRLFRLRVDFLPLVEPVSRLPDKQDNRASAANVHDTDHRPERTHGADLQSNAGDYSAEGLRAAHLLLTGDHKDIFSSLSRKIVQNGTIYLKNSVGVGGVQNRQSGCYRRMPFLAPIKDGIRQGAEQLVTRQQRTGGR